MPRGALVLALAVMVAVAAFVFAPPLGEERDVLESSPSPPAFVTLSTVDVGPGKEACLDSVALTDRSEVAFFTVGTKFKPGAPLELRLKGPGYEETAHVRGGYPDNSPLRVPITPPRRPTLARACIRNRGRTAMALYGTTEGRTQSRPVVRLDGRRIEPDVTLLFYRREPASIASLIGDGLDRMSVFRPGLVADWMPWALLVLVVLGVPGGALYALHLGFASERSVERAARDQA